MSSSHKKLRYSLLILLFGRLVLCLSAIWMPPPATAAPSGQRPAGGCPSKCGDVDIPFPFGIGRQCALQTSYDFKLDCLSVGDGTSKPFFRGNEVTRISLSEGKASMKMNISTYCYDSSTGTMKDKSAAADFSDSPYWISDEDNKVIVIGCQTFAYMQINFVLTGCTLICNKDFIPTDGLCSGAGCCQLDFPKGTWYYNTYFSENFNTSQIWKSSPCSYMAIIESAAFNFSATYVNSTIFYDTYKGATPVALDWIITIDTKGQLLASPYRFKNHGASVGLVILVIAITCVCFIKERRKLQHIKQKYFRQHGGLLLFEEMKSQQGVAFKIFSEKELQQATNKFDERQVLGKGGNGTVYKGLLNGNIEVAVKRCMTMDDQKKKEFGKEMLILSQINHKNIVKLLGCCLEVEVPMLVYEFIPNSTLFHLIHGNHGRCISLDTRLRIAQETAEALAYLHSCASPPIFHGDVKSSNILLDANLSAKVSDFGASILAPTDEAQFVTLVQGTCGYLDPEYMQTCQLTDKSDVYSFGVVLLELLTRKKPINLVAPDDEKSLTVRFLAAMNENKLEGILDVQIKNENNLKFLHDVAKLAMQCLEMSGVNRPSMKEVGEKLDAFRKAMEPWVQQNLEEFHNIFAELPMVNSQVISSGNFSTQDCVVTALVSGR